MSVTTTVDVPVEVGVPVMTPVVLIVRPVGKPAADHVNGAMPPVAVTPVPG